jgi:hypothetical protein
MKIPFDKITEAVMGSNEWFYDENVTDPSELEIPEKQ